MTANVIEDTWKLKFPDQQKLRFYHDPRFKLIFGLPEDWINNSDIEFFQFEEPGTETYFTASGYEMKGMPLAGWAKIRLSIVVEKMPYLSMVGKPYSMTGQNWVGYATDFEGKFPGKDYTSHYLVVCLTEETTMISFTITTRKEVFEKNKEIYLWLAQNTLVVERSRNEK